MDLSKLFFTSDPHFGHKAAVRFRPNDLFTSVEEMDEVIIQNWNGKVPEDGIVYILGDVFYSKPNRAVEILNRLNGEIHLVRGNHDSRMKAKVLDCFASVEHYAELKIKDGETKQLIVMCHYPILVWKNNHHGSWHLHGHCHGGLKPLGGRMMDVGVDVHNYKPVGYSEVKDFMSKRMFVGHDHHKEGD